MEDKKQCLETLGAGWLVQLICDDTEDEGRVRSNKNEKPSTAATRSPSADDMDEDVDMEPSPGDGYRGAFPRTSHERSPTGRLRVGEMKISALRDAESNPFRKARTDDLAVQEQGLNFLQKPHRPGDAGSSADGENDAAVMIDYLFDELGRDRLFEILAEKLKVKVLHPFSRRYSAGQELARLYPQAKIIEAVGGACWCTSRRPAAPPPAGHRAVGAAQGAAEPLLQPQQGECACRCATCSAT